MKRKIFLIILTILATIVIAAIISNQVKTTENKLVMHASKWSASQGYVDVSPGDYIDLSEDRQIAEAVSNSSIIEGNLEVPESILGWTKDILGDQTSKTIVVKIGNDIYTVTIKYETTVSKRSQ